jgi:hypothetical protein
MTEHEHSQTEEPSSQAQQFLRAQPENQSNQDYDAEYSAELAQPHTGNARTPVDVRSSEGAMQNAVPRGKGLGYAALVVGILSLFFFPALFGSAAIVIGIISYFQGNRALGAWSVVLGLISLGGYYLLVPYYA